MLSVSIQGSVFARSLTRNLAIMNFKIALGVLLLGLLLHHSGMSSYWYR